MVSFNVLCNVVLFSLFLLSLTAESQPVYLYSSCTNDTTFTPNGIYQRNRDSLLSSLSSNATQEHGFYNATAGQVPSDTAYGLFLCRGDVTMDMCQKCVQTATREVVRRCPREKVSIIWYDECLVRYSNQSIVSKMQDSPGIHLLNTGNISEPERFMQLLARTMNDTAARAANDASGRKFATDVVNFTSFQSLYTLVQCTPDLSAADCNMCLQEAINLLPRCCNGKQGGRTIFPSCSVRYELYPFYQIEDRSPAPSPTPVTPAQRAKGKKTISALTILAIVAAVAVSVVLFIAGLCLLERKARKRIDKVQEENGEGNDISTVESLQYELATIKAATNNFSSDNKLGAGGYGEVYKGILPDGQEIAVKRLSAESGQGAEQFKNEVVLAAKLQHRNLVRIVGFCLEGGEKMVIYEFVPNKSLDYFLFGPGIQGQLDWPSRYKTIWGIARGMLYLHEESRLKIIHRDLKASNILLDKDMNPKISDFGMSRIFGEDQTQANTNRIVGTYGYLSPEYAMRGQFSMKSDVYSFGVLILEIISGRKNCFLDQSDAPDDLLSHAWRQWSKGTPLELLDPTLRGNYPRDEVIRCMQLGLLCVQENPTDRPTMATIVLMLDTYSVSMQLPQKPAFFLHNWSNMAKMQATESGSQGTSKSAPCSVDEASITEVYPR